MTMWIVLLRAVGTLIFLVGVVGGSIRFALNVFRFYSPNDVFLFALEIVVSITLAMLCFGLAAGLRYLQRMGRYLARLNNLQRQAAVEPVKDLAPVAPNWDHVPEPRVALEIHRSSDSAYPMHAPERLRRFERMGKGRPSR